MRLIFAFAASFARLFVSAQPFSIGERSITFFDDSRNRSVPVDLYYPAAAAGTNTAFASGEFPVLVVGHGFVMAPDAYGNLWDRFVPRGYILALPTTEGGFLPNHGNFGADLAFIGAAIVAANEDAGSPLYQHVQPSVALMGHSMGGGAAFLGAANNAAIRTVVTLAPAETNPSAVSAAANVQVPTLVFAGSNDCVTPIPDHAGPIFDAVTASCRAFVNITGGGHCFFAENNFNCSFGELTCSPTPSISRGAQHDLVNDFAGLWLDHFLKDDPSALETFRDSADLSTRAVSTIVCALSTGLAVERVGEGVRIFPVPASSEVRIEGLSGTAELSLLDICGRTVVPWTRLAADGAFPIGHVPDGSYQLELKDGPRFVSKRLVVSR